MLVKYCNPVSQKRESEQRTAGLAILQSFRSIVAIGNKMLLAAVYGLPLENLLSNNRYYSQTGSNDDIWYESIYLHVVL